MPLTPFSLPLFRVCQARNAELSDQLTVAAARIMSLETDLLTVRRDKDLAQRRVNDLQREVQEHDDHLGAAKLETARAMSERENLQKLLATRDTASKRLEHRISQLEKDIAAAASSRLSAESELAIVAQEREALLARLESLSSLSAATDVRLENALHRLRERSKELAAVKQDVTAKDAKIDKLQGEKLTQEAKIESLKGERTNLENEVEKLTATVTKLSETTEGAMQELRDARTDFRVELDKMQDQIAAKSEALREGKRIIEEKVC